MNSGHIMMRKVSARPEKDRHAGLTSQTHPPPVPLHPNTDVNAQANLHQLCNICLYITQKSRSLRHQVIENQPIGPNDYFVRETFTHYETTRGLELAVEMGCHLCTLIFGSIEDHLIHAAQEIERSRILDQFWEPTYKTEILGHVLTAVSTTVQLSLKIVFREKIQRSYQYHSPELRILRYHSSLIPSDTIMSGHQ